MKNRSLVTLRLRERLAAQIAKRPMHGRAECWICLDTRALDERGDCYDPECVIISGRLPWYSLHIRLADGTMRDAGIRGEDKADALACARLQWPDASEITLRADDDQDNRVKAAFSSHAV